MSQKFELKGVITPVITPTDPDDRVNEPALRKHIQWLLSQGVHGIFVGGTAGEGPLLTAPEWRRLVEVSFDEVGGKAYVVAGTMDTSTRRVIDKIKIVRDIGYVHFVVTPTFYVPVRGNDEHMRLFSACYEAGGSNMNMVPYNLPSCTQSVIAVETMVELARRGWARYCKESSGNAEYVARLLAEAPGAGMTVLMGNEIGAAEAMLAGAGGMVPVCSNFEPRTYIDIYEAGRRGDRDACTKLQSRIQALVDNLVLAGPCFLAGPKHLVARRLGANVGQPISPLSGLSPELTRKMDAFFPIG